MKKVVIVLAVLFVLCLAATAVLADDMWGENCVVVGNEDIVQTELFGNASSTNLLRDKINGYYDTNESASVALFDIQTALVDSDWITVVGQPNEKYLRIQSFIKLPSEVNSSPDATKYYMQFRNSDGGEWSFPNNQKELRPLSEGDGPKFSNIGSGTRYDKSQYDQYRGFYQEVMFTWCNDAGVPVEGLEPTVHTTQIALSYRPSEVPVDRLTAAVVANITKSSTAGRVNYTLGSGFTGSSEIKTLVTPPYGFQASDCIVYTDDGFSTVLAGGKTVEEGKLAITVTANSSETTVSDGEYYLFG